LVVPFNPTDPLNKPKLDAFKTYYGITPAVQIVGGYQGHLSNTGDRVQLQRPDSPPLGEPGFYPGLLADEVVYGTAVPWPADANGLGKSLVRQGIASWGDNAASWAAAAPTPGMVALPAVVVARQVFYNNSAFDGNNPAANAQDDQAIAADKQVLLPGQTATFANYTSFAHGINGIMIDVAGLGTGLSAADFSLTVGNNNTPGGWAAAPPASMTVRLGAGLGGSDRVELIWLDGAITNRWLQVTIRDTSSTNLAAPDVFYVGNAIGETGNDPANALVNAADLIVARQSKTGFAPAPITAACDFNRDRHVNATDEIIARNNRTGFTDALRLITARAGLVGMMTQQKAATVGRASMTSVSPAVALQARGAVLAVADGELSAENWLRQWAWFDALQPASEKKTAAKKGGAVQAAAVDAVLAQLAM
jgi:hypothetical protein